MHVTVLEKCVMDAIHVREKFFMQRKEKPARFMIASETKEVCKTVGNVVKFLARYGLTPEIPGFQMRNSIKM